MAEEARSISDAAVLELANREDRLLITNDKDFGELIFLLGKVSTGVILIRSQSESVDAKISQLEQLLVKQGGQLRNSFTILTDSLARIRPLQRQL